MYNIDMAHTEHPKRRKGGGDGKGMNKRPICIQTVNTN